MDSMCNLSMGIVEDALEKGMKRGLEQGLEQGMERGLEQGKKEKTEEMIMRMEQAGFPKEVIAQIVGVSVEEVKVILSKRL